MSVIEGLPADSERKITGEAPQGTHADTVAERAQDILIAVTRDVEKQCWTSQEQQ